MERAQLLGEVGANGGGTLVVGVADEQERAGLLGADELGTGLYAAMTGGLPLVQVLSTSRLRPGNEDAEIGAEANQQVLHGFDLAVALDEDVGLGVGHSG